MLQIELAKDALRASGVRLTPQRLMVIEALVGNRTHPTIEQVYEIVRRRYPTVSLATVYQTVSLLARHGLILELKGGKDGIRCDPDTSPHAHAYCQQCGTVYDIALPHTLQLDKLTTAQFHPKEVEVSLYGCCNACVSKSAFDD